MLLLHKSLCLNTWVLVFFADRELNVDVSYMKRRFYSSCNSILCKSKLAPEPVKLQLIKSYCLPYLTYCIGALQLSETKLRELNVCWNDAFRRVFGFKRYESVKELQWYCGEMSLPYIYYLARWNCVMSVSHKNTCSLSILYNIMHSPDEFVCNGQSFGRMFSLFDAHRDAVFN